MYFEADVEEWGGYMGDAGADRGAFVSFGMGALDYVPDLSPTGAGAQYYPRDTMADAKALNYLGYFPDALLAQHVGTSGSAAADMAAKTGAWSPAFQQAVRDFQEVEDLTVDGWTGIQTRTRLGVRVAEKNAKEGGLSVPLPNIPNVIPSPNGQPAAKSNTKLYVGVGLGAVAVGLGVWWLLK